MRDINDILKEYENLFAKLGINIVLIGTGSKRKFTPTELLHAQAIVEKIVAEKVLENKDFIIIDQDPEEDYTDVTVFSKAYFSNISTSHYIHKKARAVCGQSTEWHDDIGKMVALCKAYDYSLPPWMNKEEK